MLLRLPNYFTRYFSPDDGVGGGETPPVGGPPTENKEEVIEFLGIDDDDKAEILDIEPKPKTKEGKEPKEKTEDDDKDDEENDVDKELKEIEEELEGPTEEQLELMTPVRRQEILKEYPDLFKKFPYLERAYYREQQFTELLPTIEDARNAVESSRILNAFEQDVQQGNTETILRQVAKEAPDAFLKIVDNYLPTLARVDERAYHHVLGNITRHTIGLMVREGKQSNNEPLIAAAQLLNQFAFGTSNFTPPSNLSKGDTNPNPQNNELDRRQQEFAERQFRSTVTDLNTKVNNSLKATIEAHIDTNNSMTEYVRKNAVKDAIETLETLVGKDTRFRALTDRLWRNAQENNFSPESVGKIKSAFLAKSKALLPSVIKKARNDALRGHGKKTSDEQTNSSGGKKGPLPQSKPGSSNKSIGKITNAKEIPRGTSTLDFLNSD